MAWKKILRWFLLFILIVSIAAAFYSYIYINQSSPKVSGTVYLQGLGGEVTVIRDNWGIPHIKAKKNSELYYALGYVMAQDRLWQMDLLRRVTSGRLSEIFPKKNKRIIQLDRLFRVLCIRQYSEKLYQSWLKKDKNSNVIKAVKQYVSGINAYVTQQKKALPMEFIVLGYEPEPFTEVDVISIGGYLGVGINSALKMEILIGKLIHEMGYKRTMEIFPDYPNYGVNTISPQLTKLTAFHFKKSLMPNKPHPLNLFNFLGGSNGWVLSGQKTKSGKVVLANDPHLLYQNPSIWYEAHIKSDKQDFYGFFFPLAPFGMIGYNRNIAWGITMMMLDECDFYIEKIKKVGPDYFYFYKGKWQKAELIRHKIAVKGHEDIRLEIPITHHGPVINELFEGLNKTVSMRWSFYDLDNISLKTFYYLNHAKDWQDFKQALSYHKAPGINVLYGDNKGNIGYYAAGAIPIRAHKGDGLFPMDGTSGDFEWQGYVPFEQQPNCFNPPNGFIASANNKIIGQEYPYYISQYWEPNDRVDRITELIQQKPKLSLQDHQRMQMDTLSNAAKKLFPFLLAAYKNKSSNLTKLETQALEIMKKWDYNQPVHSVAASIYNKWYFLVLKNVLKNKLDKPDFEDYLESRFSDKVMHSLFFKAESHWFDNPKTPKIKETRDDILINSFQETLLDLSKRLGKNINHWQWGVLHQVSFSHPFSKQKPLNYLFNVGPFAIGGNRQSLNKAHYLYDLTSRVIVGPSMRMIVDFSDISKTRVVNTIGQSGHFYSKHFKDQIKMWRSGKLRISNYNQEDINQHQTNTLILKPAKR